MPQNGAILASLSLLSLSLLVLIIDIDTTTTDRPCCVSSRPSRHALWLEGHRRSSAGFGGGGVAGGRGLSSVTAYRTVRVIEKSASKWPTLLCLVEVGGGRVDVDHHHGLAGGRTLKSNRTRTK